MLRPYIKNDLNPDQRKSGATGPGSLSPRYRSAPRPGSLPRQGCQRHPGDCRRISGGTSCVPH